GAWNLTKYEQDTVKAELLLHLLSIRPGAKGGAECVAMVQGNRVSFRRGPELVLRQAEARLDADKNRKTIDLTAGTSAGSQKSYLCIYRAQDDQWTLCLADGDPRPTQFAAKPGQVLLHYQRPKR